MATKNINITFVKTITEIELQDNIRHLHLSPLGYSYWYKGKEISNGSYNINRWFKIMNKYTLIHDIKRVVANNTANRMKISEIYTEWDKFCETYKKGNN